MPAPGWKREEVLGLGRGSGGALRGPVVQLFWKLRSHGITVARDRVVPRPVLEWRLVLEGGVSCEAGVLSGSLRKIPASPTLF